MLRSHCQEAVLNTASLFSIVVYTLYHWQTSSSEMVHSDKDSGDSGWFALITLSPQDITLSNVHGRVWHEVVMHLILT